MKNYHLKNILNMVRPDLRDLINRHKPVEQLINTNNNNNNNNNNTDNSNNNNRAWRMEYYFKNVY